MSAQPGTVGAAVEDAAKRFEEAKLSYGHGTGNAYDDAAFLVLETLGLPPYSLKKNWAKRPNAAQLAKIEQHIAARIATRKPTSYIVRRAWMQGLPFYVDERVIIPRSFVAEILYRSWAEGIPGFGGSRFTGPRSWLGKLLFREGGFNPPGCPREITSVLDLCTGSGCLAILAAHIFPRAKIDAVDLSADALSVAAINVNDSGMADRIKLHQGDLFATLKGKKYDLIITNPPYVDRAAMDALPPEFRSEPAMALAGGDDGLDLVKKIIEQAPAHMNDVSGMICEIGRGKETLEAAFPRTPFLWLDTAESSGEVFWITRKQLLKAAEK